MTTDTALKIADGIKPATEGDGFFVPSNATPFFNVLWALRVLAGTVRRQREVLKRYQDAEEKDKNPVTQDAPQVPFRMVLCGTCDGTGYVRETITDPEDVPADNGVDE